MSYKIYQVTKTELQCDDYEVKVNGEKITLDTARVSAVPFNRRWPGHQRGLEQTELINFLSLETDESLTFEIKCKKPFKDVIIRPLSLGIIPQLTDDNRIIFTLKKAAYFTVEPYGKNNALHIFADPISDYCTELKNNKNTVYFGAGEHFLDTVTLESNQTLFIDEGAVVYANIRAYNAENIKILGRGILDNSRNKAKILFECNEENNTSNVDNAVREHTVQLEYCTNIEIEGITIRDSLVYNIRPVGCENLHISNVKIIGCWRYNSDGIDMHNCKDVLIENCFLRTFDDSICVKGLDCYYEGDNVEEKVQEAMYANGKAYDVFANTVVRKCVIWNDWGRCLEIGAETRAKEIYNICFENCDIIHFSEIALDVQNVDYADVYNIVYKYINVEYDDVIPKPLIQNSDREVYVNTDLNNCPVLLRSNIAFHHEYSDRSGRRGKNSNLVFNNINVFGKHKLKFSFEGYDEEHKISNVLIKGIRLNNNPAKEEDYEPQINKFCENIRVIL